MTSRQTEESRAREVAWWCVRLLVFLVPLAITNITWINLHASALTGDQFETPRLFVMQVLAIVGMAAWSWDILRRGGVVRATRALWVGLAFLAWAGLATAFSVSPAYALFGQYMRLEGYLTFLTYGLIFFLAVQVVDSPQRVTSLAQWLVVSASIAAAYGLVQYLGFDPLKYGETALEVERAFSTLGNPDPFGGFLVLVLPISASLALTVRGKTWERLAWWGSFLVVGVALLVTFTRGAWIGGFVGAAVFVVAVALARPPLERADAVPVAGGVLAIVAVVIRSLSSSSPFTNVVTRLGSLFNFRSGSGYERLLIWQAALKGVAERPLFGAGPDTFRLIFSRTHSRAYTALQGHTSVADNAHDYPLQLASTVGVPGALLYYGTVLWVLVGSARTVFRRRSGTKRLVLAAMWSGVVGYLVHMLFGVTAIGSTSIMWVLLATLASPDARRTDVRAPSWGTVGAWAAVVLAALLVVGSFIPVLADNAYLRGLKAEDPQSALPHYERAVQLAPWRDIYVGRLAVTWRDVMLTTTESARAFGDTSQEPRTKALEAFQDAERLGKRAAALAPGDVEHPAFLVNLYTQAAIDLDPAYLERGITYARSVLNKQPNAVQVRYELAAALATGGDLNAAAQEAKRAAEDAPLWAEPLILLADVAKAQGRLEEARDYYDSALGLNDPSLAYERIQMVKTSLASVEASLAAGAK